MILETLGIPTDYVIIGLVFVTIVLLVLYIINVVQMAKLKKKYKFFMEGKNAKNLEDTLIERLTQVDALAKANEANEKSIQNILAKMKFTFQKVGLVKYDAFQEMGGKLSFSLALLNEKEDGFVMNAVHSREGCYTYIKEIIAGNSVILLSPEEKEALENAKAN